MAAKQPDQEDDREPLAGTIERVTFHSPDSGFCVLRIKARGFRDLVTVVGSAASVQPGEQIQAAGRWQTHREHGVQFQADDGETPPALLDSCYALRRKSPVVAREWPAWYTGRSEPTGGAT